MDLFGIILADFNTDTKVDLAVGNGVAGTIFVFDGNGSGSFSTKDVISFGNIMQIIVPGDFDNNSQIDIALLQSAGSGAVILNQTPPTISSFAPVSGPVGATVTIAGNNFNSTPVNNIVYFGAVRAPVTGGSTTSLTVTVPAGATYQPISVLNNATGLTGYSSKPFITTFTNPFGTGIPANFYKPKVDFVAGTFPRSVTIGDVDGDNKPDLMVVNLSANTVSVLHNISSLGNITASSFASKVDFGTGTAPVSIAFGDVDGDGKPDLAVTNNSSNTVSVFHNTSSAGSITASSFAAKVDFNTGSSPQSVVIGDADGDGKPNPW